MPDKSVAVYVTVYSPTVDVSTLLLDVTFVKPWKASDAVAPASEYVVPSSTVAGLSPLIVITGGTSSLYPSSVMAEIVPTPRATAKAFCTADNSAVIAASLLDKLLVTVGFWVLASSFWRYSCSNNNADSLSLSSLSDNSL